ncbi:MAG: hypothetical protein Q8O87_02760 [bacterium]|nr:hypothetical protein [bacterium]
MQELGNGLFALEAEMPCSPNDIKISRYMLPRLFSNDAVGEATARVISISQDKDMWVGVSASCLARIMEADLEAHRGIRNAQRHNSNEPDRVRRATLRRNALCVLTLGVYGFFTEKPVANMIELQSASLPCSVIYKADDIMGVVCAIGTLITDGMFSRIDRDNELIVFPTPKLASLIMERQGATIQ